MLNVRDGDSLLTHIRYLLNLDEKFYTFLMLIKYRDYRKGICSTGPTAAARAVFREHSGLFRHKMQDSLRRI